MLNIVDNTYYKEGEVQLMLPLGFNCTFIGPDGVKLHTNYGEMIINDYIQNPKRKLFPYHEIPTHKEEKGEFANQLFKLNKQYLALYIGNGNRQFRTDNFFQVDNTIYNDSNVDIDLIKQESKEISLTELQEEVMNILLNNVFLCIVNDDGELYEYNKNAINFELPLSGIAIFGDGARLKAYIYKMQTNEELISVESQELNLKQSERLDLEDYSTLPEPIIQRK